MAKLEGSLVEEAKTQLKSLAGIFSLAIEGAFPDFSDELIKQIEQNVYNKWPEPTEYERRTDNGGLIDPRYIKLIDETVGQEGRISASGDISYEPSGQQWQWQYPEDGDELIDRIESGVGYEWRTYDPPQRPFWRPFVESMYGRSWASAAIDRELAKYLKSEGYEGIATIEPEPGDGDYS